MHMKKNEIEAYIDSKRQEILNKWECLVNLEGNHTEKENLDRIADWLYQEFTEAGVSCELRVAHEKSGKVLVGTTGAERSDKPVIFSGHYDTVFKKGQFGNTPFHIQDGSTTVFVWEEKGCWWENSKYSAQQHIRAMTMMQAAMPWWKRHTKLLRSVKWAAEKKGQI